MQLPIHRPLISFDWAIKRLLRQKANYGILEGFLSELLRRDVVIKSIPESESTPQTDDDKTTKADILCEDTHGNLMLIELQYYNEWDFLHRMLFGSSRLIVDYLKSGAPYGDIKKVYSINIVYFELGQGTDYVYYGQTSFTGLHHHDTLQMTLAQQEKLKLGAVYEVFPEYYILKVNNFDDVAKDTLDEWMYYLKNNALPEQFRAKGLDLVAAQLKVDTMTAQEKIDYEAHIKDRTISRSMLETAKLEGQLLNGKSSAQKLIIRGFDNEEIADITGLTLGVIEAIRQEMN